MFCIKKTKYIKTKFRLYFNVIAFYKHDKGLLCESYHPLTKQPYMNELQAHQTHGGHKHRRDMVTAVWPLD